MTALRSMSDWLSTATCFPIYCRRAMLNQQPIMTWGRMGSCPWTSSWPLPSKSSGFLSPPCWCGVCPSWSTQLCPSVHWWSVWIWCGRFNCNFTGLKWGCCSWHLCRILTNARLTRPHILGKVWCRLMPCGSRCCASTRFFYIPKVMVDELPVFEEAKVIEFLYVSALLLLLLWVFDMLAGAHGKKKQ